MTSSTSLIISGSSAEVGSSKSITFGLHRQRAGDRDPLLLTAGELGRVLVGLVGDADSLEQLLGPRPRRRHGLLPAHLGRAERHVVEDGLVGEQVERLEDHPDVGPELRQLLALGRQQPAVEPDLALVDRLEAVDGPAERRLAGARRSDDDHDLAAIDREVDVLAARAGRRTTC